jgi:hypothetical protein
MTDIFEQGASFPKGPLLRGGRFFCGEALLLRGLPIFSGSDGYCSFLLKEPGSTLWIFLNMLIKALTFS